MGLLDFLNEPDARFGINLLAAASPQMRPAGFGERLGLAMRMTEEQKRRDREDKAREEQYALMKSQAMRKAAGQDFILDRLKGGATNGAPMGQPQDGAPQQGGQPPMQRQGGAFPFSINDITALNALDVPGADKLFDLYKYANDGVKREAGNYYVNPMTGQTVFMPKLPEGATMTQNGQVVPLPGAAQTNAGFKGAETFATESARAGFDFVEVPMPDGSTRTVRRDQAASVLGGQGNVGGFGVSQTPSNRVYGDETAKTAAEQYKQIQTAGFKAPSEIAKYKQLGELLANHDGGKLSGMGLDIAQAANSLGLKIDKNLSNKEASVKLTNELALALRNPAGGEGMPGAMSDADREFLMRSVPNLAQSAEGRGKMIEMQVKSLQRQTEVASMARKWQQRYGRLDAANPATGKTFYDNLKEWSEANSLFQQ